MTMGREASIQTQRITSTNQGPATPYQAFETPIGSIASDASFQHRLQTSPYPAHNGGRSYSDRRIALSRTQRSSYLMNTVVNTSSFESHGSASDTFSNMSNELSDTFIRWQPSEPPNSGYRNSSHDGNVADTSTPNSPDPSPVSTSTTATATDIDNVHEAINTLSPPYPFASLSEPPLVPFQPPATYPAALTPHPQSPRFPGDLYSPSYTRKFDNQREGWCGLCHPGRWLALKNSAFWYDKSFTHGMSAASGKGFDGLSETRKGRETRVLEGLCGTCGEWIALVVSKKGGLSWFRHAYKVSFLR